MFVSHLDVNDVSQPVGLEVGGQVLDTLLLEGACEHVAGAASVTFRVHHFELSPEKRKQKVKHCAFNKYTIRGKTLFLDCKYFTDKIIFNSACFF